MRKVIGVGLFLTAAWLPSVFPCGSEISGLRPGDKVVGIQLNDPYGGSSEWVLDDDGMLVAGIVAAYCNQRLQSVRVALSPAEMDCASKVQRDANIPYAQQIYSGYYGGTSEDLLSLLKDKCKLSLANKFLMAQEAADNEVLPCGPKVKDIVRKAANQYLAYSKPIVQPAYVANLDASPDEKDFYLFSTGKKVALLEDLAKLTAQPQLRRKEFTQWLTDFMPYLETEQFQIVKSMSDMGGEPNMVLLPEILGRFNATLPGFVTSMCGGLIHDSVIDSLSGAEWTAPASPAAGKGDPDAKR